MKNKSRKRISPTPRQSPAALKVGWQRILEGFLTKGEKSNQSKPSTNASPEESRCSGGAHGLERWRLNIIPRNASSQGKRKHLKIATSIYLYDVSSVRDCIVIQCMHMFTLPSQITLILAYDFVFSDTIFYSITWFVLCCIALYIILYYR